jgi:putative oxidoreductase
MGTSTTRAEPTRRSSAGRPDHTNPGLAARLSALRDLVCRNSMRALRLSLGLVFVWFGALKVTNTTPVAELVADTVPFLPGDWFVPALGLFEVLLGLALMTGRRTGIVVLLMVAHLAGTFLVLATQPHVAFSGSNPLLLTMTGEFVVKKPDPHLCRAGPGE